MKTIKSILLISLLTFGAITFQNCAPEETVDPIVETVNDYMEADSRSIVHTYNVSPCPQEFTSVAVNSVNKELVQPDSVVIISEHPSIDAVFESTVDRKVTVGPNSLFDENILIWFTCGTDKSFTTSITVKYYLEGEEIGSEDLKLTVTVNK